MRDLLNKHLAKVGLRIRAMDELSNFDRGMVEGTLYAYALSFGAFIAWCFLK